MYLQRRLIWAKVNSGGLQHSPHSTISGSSWKTVVKIFRLHFIVAWIVFVSLACNGEPPKTTMQPSAVIDMAQLGYQETEARSLKAAFGDIISHLLFVSDKMAVIYHTIPDDLKVIDSTGTLIAYFVSLPSGKLIRRQEWKTVHRHDPNDKIDSEARILPLADGRYVVMADRQLLLYDGDGSLMVSKALSSGIWSAQTTRNGRTVVLRHQEPKSGSEQTEYRWLEAVTLEADETMIDPSALRSQLALTAVDGNFAYSSRDGIHILSPNGTDHIVCLSELCRQSGVTKAIDNNVVLVSRLGLGVLSIEGDMLWFRNIWPNSGPDRVTVGDIQTSLDGLHFACLTWPGSTHRRFDDASIDMRSEIFLFKFDNRKPLAIVPGVDTAYTLSPDGTQVLSFDGRFLKLYKVPTG